MGQKLRDTIDFGTKDSGFTYLRLIHHPTHPNRTKIGWVSTFGLGWLDQKNFSALLSTLVLHTKFHPNRTKTGKVSALGWVREVGVVASKIFFLVQPPQPPPPPYPLCNPPQWTNFANFGPIWMKLGVEVKNGQQSSNPEWFFDSTPLTPPTTLPHNPLTHPKTLTLPILV